MLINRKRALEIGTELGAKLLEIRAELPSVYSAELSDALRDASRREAAISLARIARAYEGVARAGEEECLTPPRSRTVCETDKDGKVIRSHQTVLGPGMARYLERIGATPGNVCSVRLPREDSDCEGSEARRLRARSSSSQAVIQARKATELDHALTPRVKAQGPAKAQIQTDSEGACMLAQDLRDHVSSVLANPFKVLVTRRPPPTDKPLAKRGRRGKRNAAKRGAVQALSDSRLVKLL